MDNFNYMPVVVKNQALLLIKKLNLNVVPFWKNKKQPAVPELSKYFNERYTKKINLERYNYGIVLGHTSNMIALDFDVNITDAINIVDSIDKLKDLPKVITPNGGLHVYVPVDLDKDNRHKGGDIKLKNIKSNKSDDREGVIEVRGYSKLVVGVGSYIEGIGGYNILLRDDEYTDDKDKALEIFISKLEKKFSFEEYKDLLKSLLKHLEKKNIEYEIQRVLKEDLFEEEKKEGQGMRYESNGNRKITPAQKREGGGNSELSVEDFEELIQYILSQYTQGNRNNICLSLAGLLRKNNVDYETALDVIREIAIRSYDEELKNREYAVIYTYKAEKDVRNLVGIEGLKAVGYDVNEINRILKKILKVKSKSDSDFYIVDDRVYKDGEIVGPAIKLTRSFVDDTNGKVSYEFEFKNRKYVIDSIAELIKEVETLTGMFVFKQKEFKLFLDKQIDSVNVVYRRSKLGWEGKRFLAPVFAGEDEDWSGWKGYRKLKDAMMNNVEKQYNLVKEALEDGKLLGFGYVFGLSSSLLGGILPQGMPLTLFLTGVSRVGKTTLGRLITNLYFDSNKTMITLNTTEVGAELLLTTLSNTTVLLDEAMLKHDFFSVEKFVFGVSAGRGRNRGNKNLEITSNRYFTNTVITSEVKENEDFKTVGVYARMFAFTIENFKEQVFSKVSSAGEMHKYLDSYGLAWKVIEFMMNNYDRIISLRDEVLKEIEDLNLTQLSNLASPVLLSLAVFEEYYNVKFNNLRKFIYDLLLETKIEFEKKTDIVARFDELFSAYLVRKTNNIVDDRLPEEEQKENLRKRDVIGRITKEGVFYITTTEFVRFCKDHKFEMKALLNKLRECGILKTSKGNEYRTYARIMGYRATVYAIDLQMLERYNKDSDVIVDSETEDINSLLDGGDYVDAVDF